MKIKKWHLFVIIIILFTISFFVVNLKFDKFYRLNDINNDNRVLIEAYLDDKEQQYLIENQIPIKQFIDLIDVVEFNLYNYQYYNILNNTGRYTIDKEIVTIGNSLAARLEYLFNNPVDKAKLIVDNNLELDFIDNQNFDLEYLDYYLILKPLYSTNDTSYINDLSVYINKLNQLDDDINIKETLTMLCDSYGKEELKDLLNKNYDLKESFVINPNDYLTIVNEYNYIGQYKPKDLYVTQNLPRKNYSMYLRKDAYMALVSMYQDLSKECKFFVLLESFKSYDSLLKDQKKAGYEEMQLGLSVVISQKEVSYEDFNDTKMCKWLEENAYKYGFILRYPKNKASTTNHSYDSHVYRYVGIEHAKAIYDSNLTLEEYVNSLN